LIEVNFVAFGLVFVCLNSLDPTFLLFFKITNMAVIPVSEYDASYFEGGSQTYTHNGGYTWYGKTNFNTKGIFAPDVPIEESTGNVFGDMIKALNFRASGVLVGKKCLVLGCAYGFEVKAMRDLGVDAYGIDVSAFAISQASAEIAPYLSVHDARTYLPTLGKNAYDYIFSRGFLECLTDAEVTALIIQMDRVSKSGQMHQFVAANADYYNVKTLQEWATQFNWSSTILMQNWDYDNWIQL
jgi:hypothetical protein